jgi:hypothetical protein
MKWSQKAVTPRGVLVLAGLVFCLSVDCASAYDTNDLWLEMALTNNNAAFILHPPATNADGVYDLYGRTNLVEAQDWTWLMRSSPDQTNLVVTNLCADHCFFRAGFPNAIRSGFDQEVLTANDDGSTDIVPMGFYINFYGNSNAELYVNNNGDVTFDYPQSAYTPKTLISLGVEVIAPFWADVDTRDPVSDVVKYGTNTVDGHLAFGVDWINVGYYQAHADRLLSCQLVIIDRPDIAAGDFDIEFNYEKVQWQWGDVTQNIPPRAGFANSITGYELPGSGTNGMFMDTNTVTGLVYNSLNSPVLGRYVFRFRDGTPLP